MAVKKIAISVPQDVMRQVDRAAAARKTTRSRFITDLLRIAARSRSDAEVTRRLNEVFAHDASNAEQLEAAEAFGRTGSEQGTEW